MRILFYLLVMGALLMGCGSKKKMLYVETEPVEVAVEENVQEEKVPEEVVVEEAPVVVRQEKVTVTHGADLMRYCIIVGSFVNEQYAVNLRQKLAGMDFSNTSIMRNEQGMYRVSAVCYESEADARKELSRIRKQYPQFKDAWLLKTKN